MHLDPRAGLDREQVRVVRQRAVCRSRCALPDTTQSSRALALGDAGGQSSRRPPSDARRDVTAGRARQRRKERAGPRRSPRRSSIAVRSSSLSQFPDKPHARYTNAAAHARRRRWGCSASCRSSEYSTGRSRHLCDPRRAPLAEPGVHRRGVVVPSRRERLAPCDGSRSCGRSDRRRACGRRSTSDSRPLAARSSRSILEQAFAGRDEPCANHRSLSERGADVRHAPPIARGPRPVRRDPGRSSSPSSGRSDAAATSRSCSTKSLMRAEAYRSPGFDERLARVAEPALVQARVHPAALQQFRVRPLLDQSAGVEDQHAVRVLGRRQPVRDQ